MTLVLVVEGPAQTHQDHLHHPDLAGVLVVVVVGALLLPEALGQVSEMLNQEQPEKRYEKKRLQGSHQEAIEKAVQQVPAEVPTMA